MSTAATGSLGALLMFASLAAIPVLAIVGVPRFSTVFGAQDDEEVTDLGAAADDSFEFDEGSTSERSARKSPGDLFEPFDSGRPRSGGRGKARSGVGGSGELRRESRFDAEPADDSTGFEGTRNESRRSESSEVRSRRKFRPDLIHPVSPRDEVEGDLPLPGANRNTRPSAGGGEGDPVAPGARTGSREEQSRWAAAWERLRENEVKWHQLNPEMDRDGNLKFVFTCFVTTAADPEVHHRYDASGETAIAAVEATIEKIESLKRRPSGR